MSSGSEQMKSQLGLLKRKVRSSENSDSCKQIDVVPTVQNEMKSASEATAHVVTAVESSSSKTEMHLFEAEGSAKPKADSALSVPVIKWACRECNNECVPIIRESRCLCGHRMKEHKPMHVSSSSSLEATSFPCGSRGCQCQHFFFLVAEGSWILRCRCKHKHIDHDCSSAPFRCKKCSQCVGFDSPWVCNCGHPWAAHKQYTTLLRSAEEVDAEAAATLVGKAGTGLNTTATQKKTFYLRQDGVPENER